MPRRDRSRSRTHNREEEAPMQGLFRQWAQANVLLQQRNSELLQQLSEQNLAARQHQAPQVSLPKFDGTRSWAVFLAQFESATTGWSEEAKGRRLLLSLEGRAADVVLTLPAAEYADYARLRECLEQHYNPGQRAALAEAELDRRTQGPQESLTDFGADVLRLARVAYPSWPEEAVQTVAKKSFLSGVADPDVGRTVRLRNPATFSDAMSAAIQVEIVGRMYPPGKRPRISQVPSTSTAADAVHVAAVRSDAGANTTQQLLEGLQALVDQLTSAVQQS